MNRPTVMMMVTLALAACTATAETTRTTRQQIARAHACEELTSCGPEGCRCGATTSTDTGEQLPAIAPTACTTCHSDPAAGALVGGLAPQEPPPPGCSSCHAAADSFLRGCALREIGNPGDFGDLPGDPPDGPPIEPFVIDLGDIDDVFPCDIPSIPVLDFIHIASSDDVFDPIVP